MGDKWPFKWIGKITQNENGGSCIEYDHIKPYQLKIFSWFGSAGAIAVILWAITTIANVGAKGNQIEVNTAKILKIETAVESYCQDSVVLEEYCKKTDCLEIRTAKLEKAIGTLAGMKDVVDKTYTLIEHHINGSKQQ
jgi:hypothetical protein